MTDTGIKSMATVFPDNTESKQAYNKFPRRRSIIREFALNTSTHGLPGIARSQSIHNRVFWTLSTLFFTGIMLFFVIESIEDYFSYPTQTSVSFIVNRSQDFPAVSICNYSPLRYDTFIKPFLNYTNSKNFTNTSDTSTISAIQSSYIPDFLIYQLNTNQSLTDYFFPLKSMLMWCFYNGVTCQHTDFITFLSSSFGQCYTFNAKMKENQTSLRSTTESGGTGNLQFGLYAHSHQYVPYVAEGLSKKFNFSNNFIYFCFQMYLLGY